MAKTKRITKATINRAFKAALEPVQKLSEALDRDPKLRKHIGTIVVMAYLPPKYRTKKYPILATLHGRCGYSVDRMRREGLVCATYLKNELHYRMVK